ncbi:SdrD B-like domain-containing protein [Paenibacillus sp. HB172176]|uniref:SdrD B-like domain-containing protein n=1 Tax=Paenibacillus sp. HB172176 TaxID=2493690 RepID=UPI001439339C|nr:SdrD B-like domain-containing protein [Paenibacillus sp. HB172176]
MKVLINWFHLSRKNVALAISLLLLLQTMFWGGMLPHTSAEAVDNSSNVIKQVLLINGQDIPQADLQNCFTDRTSCNSVTAAVYYDSGSLVSYTNDFETSLGAADYPFTLAYNWEITADQAADGGTYTFNLPDAFMIKNDIDNVPLDTAGSFSVNKTTKQITITFNKQTDALKLQGGLVIEAWLEEATEIVNNEIVVNIPISGSANLTVNIPVDLQGSSPNIDKRLDTSQGIGGVDRTVNTSEIYWTIDANTNLASMGQAIIQDSWPSEVELDPSTLKVYNLNVSMNGSITQGSLVDPADYALDLTTPGQFAINLGVTQSAYRVTYKTKVKSDAPLSETPTTITNTAQLLDGASVKDDDSASLSVQRGQMLRKSNSGYDAANNHRVTWEVLYNFGELEESGPTLTDTLPAGHHFVPGTLTVESVEVNSTGGAGDVITTLSEGVAAGQYTLNDNGTSFDLTLNGTITHAYKITYATESKDNAPITSNGSGTNTISATGYTGNKTSTVNYQQQVISKGGSIVDYSNKEIEWNITLNENGYWFKGDAGTPLTLEDTFSNRGLTLLPGTLAIKEAGGATLTEGIDYTVQTNYDGTYTSLESGFTITFNNSYDFNKKLTITYRTTFDYDKYKPTNPWTESNYNFQNSGKFSWNQIVASDGTTIIGTAGNQNASHTVTPNDYTRYNGYKDGSYDATDKTLSWNVLFNYHNESVQDAVVTDTLESGQELVPGTLVVKQMSLSADANGNLSEVATLIKDTDYTLNYDTSGSDPVLTISFSSPTISGPHLISYKTTLEDKLVPHHIDNTALFTSTNGYTATLEKTVNLPYGDEYLKKSFEQDPSAMRLANWTLWINRSQSKLSDVVIVDKPDQYQTLAHESFKLEKAVPNRPNPTQDSHFTFTTVDPSDYTITFSADPDTAQHLEMFTLSIDGDINGEIEAAYRLTYQSLLAYGVTPQTENHYDFSATQKHVVSTSTEHQFSVTKNSGSGFTFPSSADYQGSLKLTKVAGDDGSIKLAGASFKIKSKFGGTYVETKTTDVNGEVVFSDLPFDQYELVEVTAPNGYLLDSTVHDIVINSTTEQEITLTNTHKSKLGNYVWFDLDRDGIQDAGEVGINGVTVNLYKEGETTVFKTTTTATNAGKDGYYLFDELIPGNYVVQFEYPDDYEPTQNVAGQPTVDSNPLYSENKTAVITLDRSNNFEDLSIDLGLVAKGEIGDYVWLDWDRDGLQDASETGLNGIEVILFKETGGVRTEIARTTTGDDPVDSKPGYYLFDQLLGGDYYVQFTVPSSYIKTGEEALPTSGLGSNVTDASNVTDKIVIGGPDKWVNHTIDLGLQGKGKLGDYVWFDTNDDGIQDSGEPGIANIEVKLYEGASPSSLTLVATQYTDSNGYYLFDHLVEGNYYVKFQTPSIYDLAKSESAGSSSSNDSNSIFETGPNKGLTQNAIPIGGLNPWSDLTIDLGFSGKGAIGNYVWHDRNWNGVQDEGSEHGINGVNVYLYRDTPTGTPYKTDVTKTEGGLPGYYSFTELPQGTYYVKFDYDSQYNLTTAETDSDSQVGSNALDADNITGPITISEMATPFGWVNPSIDLGLTAQGTIGNYVWLDRNRNGIQDEPASEGLNGFTVKLYKDSKSGDAYAETVTANGPGGKPGYYEFDNLASGTYYVQILFDSNYETTTAEQGSGSGADELDSNSVDASGFTSAIVIDAAGPKGWHDPTIDFGLVRKGQIGNYVWQDVNYNGKQDDDEKFGRNGLTVKLYDSSKHIIATTVTADKNGKSGYYLFDHLTAGDYYVSFEKPGGYVWTKAGASGVAAAEDSNITFDGLTEVIRIGDATVWEDMTIDQGFYFIPYIPLPSPSETPSAGPEESPGMTPTPTPTSSATPAPTPSPGASSGIESPAPSISPTSTPKPGKTPEDTPIELEVDVPPGGTTDIGTPPGHGEVTTTPDGKVIYKPDPGYTGNDEFSIIVKDENGEEEEIWFDIDVEEIPLGNGAISPDVDKLPKTGERDYSLLYALGIVLIGGGLLVATGRRKKSNRS